MLWWDETLWKWMFVSKLSLLLFDSTEYSKKNHEKISWKAKLNVKKLIKFRMKIFLLLMNYWKRNHHHHVENTKILNFKPFQPFNIIIIHSCSVSIKSDEIFVLFLKMKCLKLHCIKKIFVLWHFFLLKFCHFYDCKNFSVLTSSEIIKKNVWNFMWLLIVMKFLRQFDMNFFPRNTKEYLQLFSTFWFRNQHRQ